MSWEGIARAVLWLEEKLREVIGEANPGEPRKRLRNVTRNGQLFRKGTQYTVYPHPALKGQPPRKRTGNLQKNVDHIFLREQHRARLGVKAGARYGFFLELKDHPWFMATILRYKEQWERLARGG
jgi:hypothetical protein